jgi:hypothetical protein
MDIYRKIEEIRQKPEHIRMRYVWASVAVSMFFILIIWFMSFGVRPNSSSDNSPKSSDAIKKSIKLDGVKSALDDAKDKFNGIKDIQNKVSPENNSSSGSLPESTQ